MHRVLAAAAAAVPPVALSGAGLEDGVARLLQHAGAIRPLSPDTLLHDRDDVF